MFVLFSTFFSSVISNKNFKYLILILVFLFILFFGYYKLTSYYYNSGYSAGLVYQKTEYEKQQNKAKLDYESKLLEANKITEDLNSQLYSLRKSYEDYKVIQKTNQNKLQRELNEYSKNKSSNSYIDPVWMQLYKDSLPE